MFELVVGEVGAILGGLEEDREFADLVLDAWLFTTEAAREEAFDGLGVAACTRRSSTTRAPRPWTNPCSAKTSRLHERAR